MFNKTILFTLILILGTYMSNAQKDDYSSEWKKVDALDAKGLTKDALAATIKIFNDAVQKGNEPQQIKGAMYQMRYRNLAEEDNIQNNILFLDTMIMKAKSPAKNILQSMQADLYRSYRDNNRYKLYNRTALAEEKPGDITSWSLQALNKKIALLYKTSLQNDEALKRTNVSAYYAVIEGGKNTESLRPALFDFLAFRALEYFMSTENDVTSPAYKFIINDEKAFAPAAEFARHRFITKDSASLYYNALLIMQQLLGTHLNDAQPAALLDADLIRLDFVKDHGVFTDKEKLFESALQQIETKYADQPASAQASYLRAVLHRDKGNTYDPFTNKEPQQENVKARQIAEAAYAKFPKSEGGINSYNLLQDLKTPSLQFETEKVNLPDQPFRALVKYRNTGKVYFRLVKTDREEIRRINDRQSDTKKVAAIIALKPLRTWSVNLPDLKDLQEHSAEVKIDGLPIGTYYLIASRNEDFSLPENIISSMVTYVSNISYIINNKNEFYALNRETGMPLEKASVQLWKSDYDYGSRRYADIKAGSFITDKNGYGTVKKSNNYENFMVQVKYGNDELFTDDAENTYYDYDYYHEQKVSTRKTFLFTDRSIYRPGQTVYFKGIMTATDTGRRHSELLKGVNTTVQFWDHNAQKIGSIDVKSNDYGSFAGSFKIPEGLLNGNFRISETFSDGSVYFSVEEYKRPKFSAEIKKPEGSYRVNDDIKVTGIAKAYAGNNISGAKVTYRVVREVRYPIWYSYYYRRIFPPRGTQQQEITSGETTTNDKGEFFISFKALPDETVDKKSDPTFEYSITADVTDINGETRSGSSVVSVSYKAIELEITGDEEMIADSLKTISVLSANRNGVFEKVTVNFSMFKIQEPGRIFRERYWERADQFTMTKEEYYRNFPYDVYADEDEKVNWPLQNKVIDITDTTSRDFTLKIPPANVAPGWYKIIVTGKDKFGEDIKAEKFVRIIDKKDRSTDEAIAYRTDKNILHPGDKTEFTAATGFDNIRVIQHIIRSSDRFKTEYVPVTKNNAYSNNILLTEDDRGGVLIDYAFVKHNRIYKGAVSLDVPWDNKELKVSYETFRDKILPGSQEKWKIKITGKQAEKTAAETLISMYDASLDQFKPHSWNSLSELWPGLNSGLSWTEQTFEKGNSEENHSVGVKYKDVPEKSYSFLLNNGWSQRYFGGLYKRSMAAGRDEMVFANAAPMAAAAPVQEKSADMERDRSVSKTEADSVKIQTGDYDWSMKEKEPAKTVEVQPRKNFNETAFFFPQLITDKDGNVEFSFTMPEALTQWKMMVLAHSKELASGYSEKTTVTQKELMVQPNAPRFMREGDRMEFSAKVVNLSDKEITGTSQLELLDAATNKPVDGWFKNIFPNQYFTVPAGGSAAVKFPVEIPMNFNSAMVYRIKAVSNDNSFSDGEEAAIPVLTNRTLVTETLPIAMRNTYSKTFHFDKLLKNGDSPTLTNHSLSFEYTSNPVWYAVQALPYLMEYPYECAEQSFNRYYANTLASNIANSNPRIKAVFEKWAAPGSADSAALISNLNKNEELKSVLLQETPWVLNAKNEEQQKKNIAVLFNLVRLAAEKNKTFDKLISLQTPNGGFAWFKGGRDDRYMTQYIISGIGHLKNLKALGETDLDALKPLVDRALPYLDARIKEDYDALVKYKADLSKDHLSNTAIQYLYMRSFFSETKISSASEKAVNYYKSQAAKYWLNQSKYMQAMIALVLHRNDNEKTAQDIIESLRQNAIVSPEMGMYWKDLANSGYYWYQSPVESQAMMIEAFREISGNAAVINDLSAWLIKNKQTNQWPTTRATAEACYALLLQKDWLAVSPEVTVQLGNTIIKSSEQKTESGTGYFKTTIPGDKVEQGMGNITVMVGSPNQPVTNSIPPSYGAVYWQYFEDLDKITLAETGLKIVKQLYVEKNSDRGPILQLVKEGDELKVGDKVKVRIELRSDRELEYVHMKDMRAACMEPVNVLSEYKWQGGLGYYESTKDASTNFFFDHLPKGSYVFEYPMFVTLNGNFSNGITTIQCMYAPEFTSHSEGVRVSVEDK